MGKKKSGNKKASHEGESPAPEKTEPAQEEQQQQQPQPEEEIKKEEKPQQKEEEEEQVEEIVTAPEHQVGVDPETGEAIMGAERAEIDFEAEFLKNQEQEEEENQAQEEAGGQEKESEPEEELAAPAPAVVKVEKQASVGNVAPPPSLSSTRAEFSRKTESVQEESVSKKPLLHQEKPKEQERDEGPKQQKQEEQQSAPSMQEQRKQEEKKQEEKKPVAASSATNNNNNNNSFFGGLRSQIYDSVITSMTTRWYRSFLCKLPNGSRVLDVGIGTASALVGNRDVILARNLSIVGVDYDEHYVVSARDNVRVAGLANHVQLVHASIHDYSPSSSSSSSSTAASSNNNNNNNNSDDENAKFDAIYFSGSFMIIPNKVEALKRCSKFFKQGVPPLFFFTQSFEHEGGAGLVGGLVNNVVKPVLKFVTTIDFGAVTYWSEFEETLKKAGLEVKLKEKISDGYFRDQLLVLARSS